MHLYGLPLWYEVWENTIGDIAAHVPLSPSSPSIVVGWLWVVMYCNADDPFSLVKHGAVFVWKAIPGNCAISNNSILIVFVLFCLFLVRPYNREKRRREIGHYQESCVLQFGGQFNCVVFCKHGGGFETVIVTCAVISFSVVHVAMNFTKCSPLGCCWIQVSFWSLGTHLFLFSVPLSSFILRKHDLLHPGYSTAVVIVDFKSKYI